MNKNSIQYSVANVLLASCLLSPDFVKADQGNDIDNLILETMKKNFDVNINKDDKFISIQHIYTEVGRRTYALVFSINSKIKMDKLQLETDWGILNINKKSIGPDISDDERLFCIGVENKVERPKCTAGGGWGEIDDDIGYCPADKPSITIYKATATLNGKKYNVKKI